jgi:filamentous hemagglutinin family protein
MIPFFRQCFIIIQCGLIIAVSAKAEVITDGSLGRSTVLPGPDYQIGAYLGQQHGGNLFHSFQDFNLQASESATFSGPNSVQNIISRVTGGNPSNIDGLIRSEIPDADMYFLNPNGIIFGENAQLDVQGGFHASTADFWLFEDGEQFDARNPSDSLLTVAPIEAFGFLTEASASLSINGSELSVPTEKTLSLNGSDININKAKLTAPFGHLSLWSVQDININQAEFTALSYGGIFLWSVQDINIDQAKFTAPHNKIVFSSLMSITGSITIDQKTIFTYPFRNIFFVNLTEQNTNLTLFSRDKEYIPINYEIPDWLTSPESPEKIKNLAGDTLPSTQSIPPMFLSVNKLLINRCAGLTKETLSSFFIIDKGQKTRPSAPDDLKTHAIQITDVLPLTAYQTNTSQMGVSFDKKRQPLPLQIGCAGK